MSHEHAHVERYEPPRIEDRTEIALPLILAQASPPPQSAVFHPVPGEAYEPPGIEERTPVDLPLVAVTGSPQPTSAAFRPVLGERYEPPGIEERTEIDLPLIGSQSPCAHFCAVFTKP